MTFPQDQSPPDTDRTAALPLAVAPSFEPPEVTEPDPEPPKDRLAPQLVWEAVLFLAAAGLAAAAVIRDDVVADMDKTALATGLGLLVGLVVLFGASIRFGVPALAGLSLPGMLAFDGDFLPSQPPLIGLAMVAGLGLAAALVFGLLVNVLKVNGWLAAFMAAALVYGAYRWVDHPSAPQGERGAETLGLNGDYWVPALFLVLAVALGLLFTREPVRDLMSSSAAKGSTVTGLLVHTGATVGMGVVGWLAHNLDSAVVHSAAESPAAWDTQYSALFGYQGFYGLLAVALLAGVCVNGRRGPVTGEVWAVVAVWAGALLMRPYDFGFTTETGNDHVPAATFTLAVLLLGVVVSSVLDRLGEPKRLT
ncbi:hypothetical protein [Salininema proteolyticum]|uniref:Uncharacterized protein n=1 Tax=Salininema proteolyticum TaxID=1607685 RepID=A0ABV8U3A0_9ACTN